MNDIIETMFKKLLGKGRAFLTPKGFTSDFYDLFMSPFVELKNRIINLKFTHFPMVFLDENNIVNGEELFNLKDIEGKTLEERAANVEGQWSIFAGTQNYKQIELILQKKGLPVRIIENIPPEAYELYGHRDIGNGFLQIEGEISDPIVITTGDNTFIIQADDFMSQEQTKMMVETVVKNKPAQSGVYFIPRFLRKKEIHHKLTKSQMQTYKKKQYCDCRVPGEI